MLTKTIWNKLLNQNVLVLLPESFIGNATFSCFRNLKIEDLFKYEIGKLIFQFSKNNFPCCFSSLFTYTSAIHNRSTRSQFLNSLYFPKYLALCCQRCFSFQGTKIWNSIFPELKKLIYNRFKISLRNNSGLIMSSIVNININLIAEAL